MLSDDSSFTRGVGEVFPTKVAIVFDIQYLAHHPMVFIFESRYK